MIFFLGGGGYSWIVILTFLKDLIIFQVDGRNGLSWMDFG